MPGTAERVEATRRDGYVDGMHPKRLLDPDYARREKRATKVILPG